MNFVLKSMEYRGPDSSGTFLKDSVGLGMNRLSIVGISELYQPITSQDNRYTIVYNGEVFNAFDLRQFLISKGYVFKSQTGDTEVVLAAYIFFGDECVHLFNGMFAFVIYDSIEQTLTGFVDRVGIKPLFYTLGNDEFFFSSEIKSISKNISRNYTLNPNALFDYFRLQYVPFSATIYSDIYRLKPGQKFKYFIRRHDLSVTTWYCQRKKLISTFNFEDFRNAFEDAVERWVISEVSFGVSLSDGLDSSLIATILAKKKYTFNAYTLRYCIEGFDSYNEFSVSNSLSRKYGFKHVMVDINKDKLTSEMPFIFKALSEPYSGGISSFFIYKSMREYGEKVAMTGVGGDEIFGNYGKWRIYNQPMSLARQSLRNFIDEQFVYTRIQGLNYKLFLDNFRVKKLFNDEYSLNYFDNEKNNGLRKRISQLVINGLNKKDIVRNLDLNLQLPYEFLMMTDRFSMFNSIEARTPFLDRDFMQKMLDYKYTDISDQLDNKFILRKLFNVYNEDLKIDKSKKGFDFPDTLFYEINKELITYLLSKEFLKKQNIFNIRLTTDFLKFNYPSIYRNLVYFQLWYYYNEYTS